MVRVYADDEMISVPSWVSTVNESLRVPLALRA